LYRTSHPYCYPDCSAPPPPRGVELKEGGDDAAQAEPYIAVGCASTFGEDYPALGRVLLLQVSRRADVRGALRWGEHSC